MVPAHVFDAKIVDDKGESDGAGFVAPEVRREVGGFVAIRG